MIKEEKLPPLKIYQKKVWLEEYNKEPYKSIRQKVLDTFKDLVFIEDGHKYFLGDRELMCVSNMTHQFQEHFDPDVQAPLTYERNYDNPESKYYHMTVDEIKEAWEKNSKQACSHGTERHLFGEDLFHFMVGEYERISDDFKDRLMKDEDGRDYFLAVKAKEIAAGKVYMDMPDCLIPILAETKVYNIEKEYAYSGTFDILFYYNAQLIGRNPDTSGLYVLDWKGLDVNTPILTADGWKTMGTVAEGDYVYDENLKPTRILHTSEVHYNPCFRIEFQRGKIRYSVIADAEHRWKVSMPSFVGEYAVRVVTTKELYSIYENVPYPAIIESPLGKIVICNVEPTDTVPTRCIEVDSPTHMFMFGEMDKLTPTHNTNADLFKNFAGKTLLPPFDEMLDMPKSMYILQLNSYQMALEKIGLKVIARKLFWLLPDGTYQKIPLENITKKLNKALKEKGKNNC